MYTHIETFSSDNIDVVRFMNPPEEENSPFSLRSFIILLSFAVSAVYLERKRISCKEKRGRSAIEEGKTLVVLGNEEERNLCCENLV